MIFKARLTKPKIPKTKKTLDDLLEEGQVKTGKTLLDEKALKAAQMEVFAIAALEEARMQQGKKR